MAICDAYRGPLPDHLRELLVEIADSDLPPGLRRGAAWLLERRT